MKMLSLTEHKDPKSFRIGEMCDSAYFIPFTKKEELKKSRNASPLFINLNNNWEFTYYDTPAMLDDELLVRKDIDTTRLMTLQRS